MIIIKYLVREMVKSQLAILFVLLFIFFCQKLIRILGAAVGGEIPTNLVLTLLGLGVSEMAELILPLSLLLSILMTLGRLYSQSEVTVMHACCLGNGILVKSAMILMMITALATVVNVCFLGPWSSRYRSEVMQNAKDNPRAAALASGQFQQFADGRSVLFIEKTKGNGFDNVFLAQLQPKGNARSFVVVVANHGHVAQRADGSQVVMLDSGTRFEGSVLLRDFHITNFTNYQAIVGYKESILDPNDYEQMSLKELWYSDKADLRSELHWRLTLVFSVLVMALMVVPLSVVNPRQGRVLSMLPAMLFYLVFFLLQSSLRSNGGKGRLDPAIWMWTVNLTSLGIAILLNIWDTVAICRLRARFIRGGSV